MIFVFDLDGTICFAGRPVSDPIHAAISSIIEQGHTLIFASARPIRDMLPVLDKRFSDALAFGNDANDLAILESHPQWLLPGGWLSYGQAAHGRMVTLVPTGAIADSCRTSSLYMRIQPADTSWPIEEGSFVPWMP